VPFAVLLAALAEVPDPRRAQGQRHSMRHLLLFSVFAVLAGATSYRKITAFIALQRERLNAVFGAVFRRAPALNTLRHLFLALGRDDLEAAFRRHAHDLSTRGTPEALRTVALDGKTLRGSVEPRGSSDFDHLTDRKAVHVLSAFASDAALILAHQELAGAPDEIAAVPQLMAELGLTGVLFTADALHCQKDGFAQAAATGNALLVRVKDNQPTLHAALAGVCAAGCPFDSHETVDRGRHGRQEHRRVEVFDTAGLLDAPWQALVSCVARVLAPDLRQGHPHRPVGHARGGRLLPLPGPPRRQGPGLRHPCALGHREPGPLRPGCDARRGRQPHPCQARRDGPHPLGRSQHPARQRRPEHQPGALRQRHQLRPPACPWNPVIRTEWP